MLKFVAIFILSVLSGCTSKQKIEQSDLHQRLGLSLYEQGNYPLALREFLAAEQLNPNSPVVQNNLGLTYFMRERYELSEKHVRKSLSMNPDYTDARNNLGRILIEEGKYKDAEKELLLALNDLTYSGQDPPDAWLGLAVSACHSPCHHTRSGPRCHDCARHGTRCRHPPRPGHAGAHQSSRTALGIAAADLLRRRAAAGQYRAQPRRSGPGPAAG